MIAVDTSALAAIVFREPEQGSYLEAIADSEKVLISSATIVEARLVLYRRGGERLIAKLDKILDLPNIEIVHLDADQANIAHDAFVKFGRDSGHPARLNFGDLFSYALAKSRGVPLLFKGSDFAQTDIEAAVANG